MTPQVETALHAMSRGAMLRVLFMLYGRRFVVAAAIPAAACVVASMVWDLRWLIVALMIIFLFIPLAMAMLYFNYGFKPECFVNVLQHSVKITTSSVRVRAMVTTPDENDEGDCEVREVNYAFGYDMSNPYRTTGDALIVNVQSPSSGFLYIPYTAFAGVDALRRAVDILNNNKNNKIQENI